MEGRKVVPLEQEIDSRQDPSRASELTGQSFPCNEEAGAVGLAEVAALRVGDEAQFVDPVLGRIGHVVASDSRLVDSRLVPACYVIAAGH
jgi:hypothetical protein